MSTIPREKIKKFQPSSLRKGTEACAPRRVTDKAAAREAKAIASSMPAPSASFTARPPQKVSPAAVVSTAFNLFAGNIPPLPALRQPIAALRAEGNEHAGAAGGERLRPLFHVRLAGEDGKLRFVGKNDIAETGELFQLRGSGRGVEQHAHPLFRRGGKRRGKSGKRNFRLREKDVSLLCSREEGERVLRSDGRVRARVQNDAVVSLRDDDDGDARGTFRARAQEGTVRARLFEIFAQPLPNRSSPALPQKCVRPPSRAQATA